jgi:hypothetical protein
LQIAQRGIAGAEIVERDADADRPQIVQQLQGLVGPFEEDGFGDFDLQPVGLEFARRERLEDHLLQARPVELDGRDVDRHADVLWPAGRLTASFADRPGADRHDQPGLLGDQDELGRSDEAAAWVVPA